MQILTAKLRIIAAGHSRAFHQQYAQEAVALLADAAQVLLARRTVLAGNQTEITGYLLAPREGVVEAI